MIAAAVAVCTLAVILCKCRVVQAAMLERIAVLECASSEGAASVAVGDCGSAGGALSIET